MTKVLITGGGGFMGRAFLRRQERTKDLDDWEITAFSRDEAKLMRVRTRYPRARVIKGDITAPVESLAQVFAGFDLIIHAAANKLVDVGEWTAFETIRNNVQGAMNIANAARVAGVKRVVGISTDKAVQPVNTYGATKFLMERLFAEANDNGNTEFVCARYGNVVGSTISIITYFREQLANTGKINVTDPAMTRFYMGADEGINTILHTIRFASPGNVVIPPMRAMTTGQVAALALNWEKGILLSQPNLEAFALEIAADPRVNIIGHRPGEKLHESLLHLQESPRIVGRHEDQAYFELQGPLAKASTAFEPFEITSAKPPLGWMHGRDMLQLIEDAAGL